MTTSRTRAAALCALLATTSPFCLAAPAAAQASPEPTQPTPPRDYTIDANGVDLVTGQFYMPTDSISVGSDGGGLSYSRIRRRGGYDDNFSTALVLDPEYDLTLVTIGAVTDTFVGSDPQMDSTSGTGAVLKKVGSDYQYIASDGTIYQFRASLANKSVRFADQRVETISYPDGRIVTLQYDKQTKKYCGMSGQCNLGSYPISRPMSATSSDGYKMLFTYRSNSSGTDVSPTVEAWMTVTGVAAVNLTEGFCASAPCATGRSVGFSVNGNVESMTDARGKTTAVTSDASGQIVGVQPPGSGAMTIDYNGSGMVAHVTRGSSVWTYGYADDIVNDVVQRITTVTNPTGLTRVVRSDLELGKVISDKTGTAGATTYEYYDDTSLKAVVSPEQNRTDYEYDLRSNVTKVTSRAKNGIDTIVFNAGYIGCTLTNLRYCNKPAWTEDGRGNRTEYAYSVDHGGVTSVTRPAPGNDGIRPQTRYGYATFQARYYGASGTLVYGAPIWKPTGTSQCASGASATNPAGCGDTAAETRTEIAYSPAGTVTNLLPTGMTVRAGDNSVSATSTMIHDANGDVTSINGPLPGAEDTTYTRYDANREVAGVISADPDGADPLKRRAVRTTRDDAGRVTSVEQGTVEGVSDADWANFAPLRALTSTYDAATWLKTRDQLAANGTTYALTEYGYDADRRPTCTVSRVGSSTGGDPCVQQSGTNGADLLTRTEYDPATGRVAATWENGIKVARYGYTANGQVSSLTDARDNVTGYAYDGFDRPTTTTHAATSEWPAKSEGPTQYDADGHVTSFTKRDGTVIGSTYDALGRLTDQILPSNTNQASPHFGYDLMGRLTGASASNGSAVWTNGVAYTIDALGRTTRQVATIANAPSRETNFAYDPAGRRTRITWGPAGNFFVDYDWRPTGDLWRVRENGATAGIGVLAEFGYNDLGDRTRLTRGNGTVTVLSPDAGSRLTGYSHFFPGTSSANVTAGLTLDVLGRITGRSMDKDAYRWSGYTAGTKGYSANPLNQYAAIDGLAPGHDANGNMLSVPGQAQSQGQVYRYNALDQLTGTQSGSSVLSYDPLGRLAYASGAGGTMRFDYEGQDRIAELDAGGNITARYVHADGVDEPLVWYEGSGVTDRRWLHADERGSVIAISDASGSQTAVNRYDPYGVPASGNVGRFGYTGQAWLGDLGLWYYKARMYAPSIGRFVQTDPIGVAGGVNLYGYVGNDPINATDPSGLVDPRRCRTFSVSVGGVSGPGQPIRECEPDTSLGTYAGVGTRSFFEFEELDATPKKKSPLVGRVAAKAYQTRKISSCMRKYLASKGLGGSSLALVTFHKGDGGNLIAKAAFLNGNPAITIKNDIYVMPSRWNEFREGTSGFFEEAVHSLQWSESGTAGFGFAWTVGSVAGAVFTGDPHNSPLEAQAMGMSISLAKDYRATAGRCGR